MRSSAPWIRGAVVLCLALLLPMTPLPAEEEEAISFPERVAEALDRGVEWLLARPTLATLGQRPFAHWGLIGGDVNYAGGTDVYASPAGPTALALYTLLKCGVPADHAVVEQGFAWFFVDHEVTERWDGMPGKGWRTAYRIGWTSYEISAQILALTAKYDRQKRTAVTKSRRRRGKLKIRDKQDREWLIDLVEALVARRGVCGEDPAPEARRGWRYNSRYTMHHPRGGTRVDDGQYLGPANQDLSSTQLATLALYSAHQLGKQVKPEVWADIATFTLDCQEEDGPEHPRHDPGLHADGYVAPTDRARGFCYIRGSAARLEGQPTGAMTGCGIANLLMARDVLRESTKGKRLLKKLELESRIDEAVFDGLAWLDRNWSSFENPPRPTAQYHIYYLYSLERAMDLLGKELVGKHLWYRDGAEAILERQIRGEHGVHWETKTTHPPYDLLDTCFALLFLKRATLDIAPPPVTGR